MPSAEVYAICCACTGGASTEPGARAHTCADGADGADGPGRVVVHDHRGRGVVGVGEPGLVAAFRARADAAHRARPRQRHRTGPRPRGQVVHADLADRVPRPQRQQLAFPRAVSAVDSAVDRGPVQDRVPLEHGLRIGRNQVPPGVRARVGRVGHRQPPPGRVQVGEHVQPPVPAHPGPGPRVHAFLDRAQRRDGQRGATLVGLSQVGDPQVVARFGAAGRADHQPAPVQADRGRVVRRLVPPVAEDQHVVVRGRAQVVQVDPAVVLLLARRDRLRRQPPGVVERLAAWQPGDRGVPAAVDRPVHQLARFHVQDAQHGLLAAALGQLIGQQPAFLVRLPAVQRGLAGGVHRGWVDEHPRLAGPRVDRAQHRVFLARQPPGEELPFPAPGRDPDVTGPGQLQDPPGQLIDPRQLSSAGAEQLVLGPQPVLSVGAGRVLQPAIGVADFDAGQLLDKVEPPSVRIPARPLVCSHGKTLAGPQRVAGSNATLLRVYSFVVAVARFSGHTRNTVCSDAKPPGGGGSAKSPAAQRHV